MDYLNVSAVTRHDTRLMASCNDRVHDSGAIAVMTALTLMVMMLFAGFGVDVGLLLMRKRELQSATDLAAMAAAENPGNAQQIATQMLSTNGFPAARITNLTNGLYAANVSLPLGQRYSPAATPVNAVNMSTALDVPLYFLRAVIPNGFLTVSGTATAAEVNEAGLVAGSGLASLNGGLLNGMLGGLLGTSLSLTLVQYQGLVNAQVNALSFLNALATQAHVTAGTYGQLLSSSVSMQSVVAAEISALGQSGQAANTQAAIGGLQALQASIVGSPMVALGTLINAGIWQNAQIGSVDPSTALSANLNAYQIASFSAQIANGSNLVAASNALSIPGIANVSVQFTGIEPPQGSYFALGPVGTTVHTAQVRMLLNINLLSALSLGLASAPVNLTLYLEIASGTATIAAINCGANPVNDANVVVTAQSAVAHAYVGSVLPSAMTNFSAPVTVGPDMIVNILGLVTVSGSAQVAVQGNTTNLSFTNQQIQTLSQQTVTSTNMAANLLQNLGQSLHLTVNVLGILPVQTGLVASLVTGLLSPVFAVLDSVVDNILEALGVRLGYLDVTVTGVRCGIPALVQ